MNKSHNTLVTRVFRVSPGITAAWSFQGTIGENDNFNAESTAEALHDALKGLGANEDVIIEQLTRINNDQRQQVRDAHKKCYGKYLMDRFDELEFGLRRALKALVELPGAYAARELREAMEGPGMDEKVLIELLCTRNNAAIEDIEKTYQAKYGRKLRNDIKSETRHGFERLLLALVEGQREEGEDVDVDKSRKEAQELHDSEYINSAPLTMILTQRSWLQLKATLLAYEEIAGKSLEDIIEAEFSGDQRMGYLALIRLATNPGSYFAHVLYKAMKGAGTDEKTVIRHLINTSEVLLENVKEEYEKLARHSLEDAIKNEFSGDLRKLLCAIVRGNK